MGVPAFKKVIVVAFGKAVMIQDQYGGGGLRLQVEAGDGVDAGIPVSGTEGLDYALDGDEFDVAAFDLSLEKFESSAGGGIDFGGETGEGSELFRIEKNFIDARRGCGKGDFLFERGALFVAWCRLNFLHGLLPRECSDWNDGEGAGGESGGGEELAAI